LAKRIERVALQLTDLKNAEKMRREFSANVSHELKTPLTSISGYAEMLNSGMVRESDRADFLQKIKDESDRLITLVEDIMLLSQLDEAEAAKGAVKAKTGGGAARRGAMFESVDIAEIAAQTAEALRFKAAEHLVTVEVDAGPVYVEANRSMMAQLFFNLIDNAIKYNKPGGSVAVRWTRDGGRVSASVIDTGIGIPKKAQGRVFERFYRVDKSRSKKTGGTGLGLAIVKHIAIMHGAEIVLESCEGEGTTITFRL
jgi:two-component system phosphate regulon sensor histidine kinase PhoR